MPLDLINTLSELVAIPSVNPMGRGLTGPEFFETKMTAHLEKLFQQLNVRYQKQEVEPGRENIVAICEGTTDQVILLEAHQDTVPVDGMTIEPWNPIIDSGKLYGRGSCDIKGGMSAMLTAFSRIVEEQPANRPTVLMACTVNEEHGFSGAKALTELWNGNTQTIFPKKPNCAVIAEPTLLNVVVAHKGALRWKCQTIGKATHSSQPQLGDNALYYMAKVLMALEQFQAEVIPTKTTHPLCGLPSLSVGTIQGGISVNTVPDLCQIEIDRRLLPGESGKEAFEEICDWINRQVGDSREKVKHIEPWMWGETLSDEDNEVLAEAIQYHAKRVNGDSGIIGVPYGTDAATISTSGVPSIVFGPGSIDQAHTADEWICLDQLKKASEIYYQFAITGLQK